MSFPTTHPALAQALAARGYTVPTAVQLAVCDEAAAGRDLLVSAQTGSGKTVAFGLALAPRLLGAAERLDRAAAPLALVITPTRELALQVARELAWLYEATGARIATCVGGMDARVEARQLEAGAHIVVGTPGRLRDHLERRRLVLGELRAAVLDEADDMLDLGFREDLEFILDATPAERQTLLFSATLPHEIVSLAGSYQRDALRIETARRNEQHADIDYVAHRVSPQDVEHAVVNVLRLNEARAALVFCSTREAVNRLGARLRERGFSSVVLSGELTQHERTQALQSLRDGRSRVLVATDVAARGLDLPDLALVIHAELPHDSETLLHRSGRTGRAGRKGLCTLIVPFNRRRKADALIATARLKVTWKPTPSPEEVRARDQERFLADASFTNAASEDELARVRALQAGRSANEIALALVRLHDAGLPAAEDLAEDTGPPPRREWGTRAPYEGRQRPDRFADRSAGRSDAHTDRDRREPRHFKARADIPNAASRAAGDGPPPDAATSGHASTKARTRHPAADADRPRPPRPRRDDGREMVWFRINIGRERNADPRWLLPLICRAGGVTKTEIGAIRIEDRDTRFQIAAEFADQFQHSVHTAKKKEGHIVRADGEGAGTTGDTPAAVDTAPPAPSDAVSAAPRPNARPHADGDMKRDKSRWRDRAKPNDKAKPGKTGKSGWSPNRRDGKADAAHETKPYAPRAHEGGARAPSKFAKKKHRANATSKS